MGDFVSWINKKKDFLENGNGHWYIPRILAFPFEGHWFDIGSHESLDEANNFFRK